MQIEKLRSALSGNKSHFAKFVELKTENAVLQVKGVINNKCPYLFRIA